jgi:phosphoglycerol transferase MdoB-like AlkP superfamily enzyme
LKLRGLLRALPNRRDRVYLLSLLVPFVVYNLALKAASVLSRPGEHGLLALDLDLMWSDMFFSLGYALLWVALFGMARKGPMRWAVVFALHVVTVFVVIVATIAHLYFRENGAALDYSKIAEWNEIVPILVHDVPLAAWMLLVPALFYATLGPWLVVRVVDRGRSDLQTSLLGTHSIPYLGSLCLFLLALGLSLLSLPVGPGSASDNIYLARAPFVNVVLTGVEEATTKGYVPGGGSAVEHPAASANLAETSQTEKRNVVLVHLESTRAQSVTPYNEDLKTTPYLDELAKESLLAERAHVVVPRSSKGTVAVNCGTEPALYEGPEFEPGGTPVPCLASLLKGQGYSTIFFASISAAMDNFGAVVKGSGYEEFYSADDMDTKGFEETNTFGYEDDIMLKPSEEWLKERGDEPFVAEYFTGTGHYGYECVPNRYGYEYFSEDEELDRYHNCLRLQDIFVKNLIDQYKELGLYENTIFVFFGDHGEGFGEHDRYLHGDTIYEEGLRVPLIIHAPGWFENGERVNGLSSQIDILPTILEMLGYEVKNGEYPGYSLLHPLPEDRTLFFSCISTRTCLASLKGNEKYIYHYGNQPKEVFDLSKDPLERHNLARERDEEELDKRRQKLLEWRSSVDATYGGHYSA